MSWDGFRLFTLYNGILRYRQKTQLLYIIGYYAKILYFRYIAEMNNYMHVTTLGSCSSLGKDDRAFK